MSTDFDPFLQPILFSREPRLQRYAQMLSNFREWVLTEVDAQANYTDRYAPPALQSYDRRGEIINRVVTNSQYDAQHQEAYRRGIIGLPYAEGAPHSLSFAMGYLLSQADISLHCPVTLTGAVAYVLGYHAPENLREKFLRDVVRMDEQTRTGGTWATEKHGGSDVGATTTIASRVGDHFTLNGLKWFTSNANSGVAVATARPGGAPSGSAGLGLYLVPSHLDDGQQNRYFIRRLKDKLGTKGLPTGEIELRDTYAIEIAGPPHGFKLMMEALEYSRVHNAVGAAGVARRALSEAFQWCESREAFGTTIIQYPMVQDELLRMAVRFQAGALLAFEAALAFDTALADPEQRTWLRFVTSLAKYLTAEYAITSCRSALELIGGNGYTSDYPIARIYRDAQVLTVWEGPANIQALELLRLLAPKYGGVAIYEQHMRTICNKLANSPELAKRLEARLTGDKQAITTAMRDQQSAERYARKLLHRMSETLAFALLCDWAATRGKEPGIRAALAYFESIEPPSLGSENAGVRDSALEIVRAALSGS
ncbi:MAG TPA: acyl-CoA dehydrogenase family protein [Terriglobales bacterium]|nr:acyl-CoA dehydrogenase family protein [Terriglobales bacterium]